MPHEDSPVMRTAAEQPRGHRTVWVVLGSIVLVALLLAGLIGWLASRFVMPSIGPHLAVATAIQQEFPGSNPNVGVMWMNGRKTIRVSASAAFNPMTDSTRAEAMAKRIAEIVRGSGLDLTGYTGITVNVQQRLSAGIVHATTGRSFQFPTQAEATPNRNDPSQKR